MRYFPLQLDTRNKKLLVIGASKITARKINSFLKSEILIDIVSLDFCDEIIDLYENNKDRINLIKEKVDKNYDFKDYDLCILGGKKEDLDNEIIVKLEEYKIPYLIVSSGEESSFHLNKVINKKGLVVSVTNESTNPTVSSIIAEEIEKVIDSLDSDKLTLLNKIREKLLNNKNYSIKEVMLKLYSKSNDEIKEFFNKL